MMGVVVLNVKQKCSHLTEGRRSLKANMWPVASDSLSFPRYWFQRRAAASVHWFNWLD